MGLFYGNKNVATASTNLMFDKVYSSFWSMRVNMVYDNIYYGRNVLVEYGSQNSTELVVEDIYLPAYLNTSSGAVKNTYLYTETVYGDNKSYRLLYGTEIEYPSETIAIVGKAINKDQIVRVYRNGVEYWVCVGGEHDDETNKDYAKFTRLCTGDTTEYFKNRAIDCYHQAENKNNWENYIVDYDSTVWQRVDFGIDSSGFVNIAHLNAKLPDFHAGVEAPSEVPMDPHFSHDSGGAYYQLRVQPSWGSRIAKANSADASDVKTIWTTYDDNGKEVKENIDAAIYFNKAAFDTQLDTSRADDADLTELKKTVNGANEIKITYDGESGKKYLPHYPEGTKNADNNPVKAIDTQQIAINLPIMGNAISNVYDVLHGPARNNSKSQSLIGRLEAFKELGTNDIPISVDEEGSLIGAQLSGDTWIEAVANSANKTITIKHNDALVATETDTKYGVSELNPTHGGTITIPSFVLDAKGHVKKTPVNQTITLPSISLENEGSGNLVTGLVLPENTGAFVASNANVGTLALTEYVNDTNSLVLATDTINGAFKKLVDELAKETANRESDTGSAATALADAKTELTAAYEAADASLKADLEGQINAAKTSLDTKIDNETTARTAAITSLDNRLTTEIEDRKTAISTEQTARKNAIDSAITQEVTDRNAAISSAIGTEVTERNSAITTAISGEVTARNEAISNAINTEITNRDAAIKAGIEALDVTDTAVEGQYISQVVETDGKISVTRANLPDYSNKYDVNTKFTYNDTEMTIGDLFAKVADLEARLAVLENPTV